MTWLVFKDKARYDLACVQRQLQMQHSDQLQGQEKLLLQDLEKWSMVEESIMRQKSRARWIQLEDSNTKYFSAVLKERTQKKQISELWSIKGVRLEEQGVIREEIACFHKDLMGSSTHSLPTVNTLAMRRGPQLQHQQRLDLIAPVTDKEIHDSLSANGDDKAPGIDGYNAVFFKKTWHLIKEDIRDAVKEFFITGKMAKAINCTIITLVPKIPNPTTVNEFRPIACCSVLYNIIAKILANRLQGVVPSIICEA